MKLSSGMVPFISCIPRLWRHTRWWLESKNTSPKKAVLWWHSLTTQDNKNCCYSELHLSQEIPNWAHEEKNEIWKKGTLYYHGIVRLWYIELPEHNRIPCMALRESLLWHSAALHSAPNPQKSPSPAFYLSLLLILSLKNMWGREGTV